MVLNILDTQPRINMRMKRRCPRCAFYFHIGRDDVTSSPTCCSSSPFFPFLQCRRTRTTIRSIGRCKLTRGMVAVKGEEAHADWKSETCRTWRSDTPPHPKRERERLMRQSLPPPGIIFIHLLGWWRADFDEGFFFRSRSWPRDEPLRADPLRATSADIVIRSGA